MPEEATITLWQMTSSHLQRNKRSLLVLETITRNAETRGFTFSIKGKRTYISRDGCSMWARLIETSDKASDVTSRSGKLKLIFTGRFASAKFEDKPGRLLEDQTDEILERLTKSFARETIEVEKFESALRERREKESARFKAIADEENRRKEKENEKRLSAARREELLAEANRWEEAARIRRYVSAVSTAGGNLSGVLRSDLAKWADWANGIADALDPLAERIAQGDIAPSSHPTKEG